MTKRLDKRRMLVATGLLTAALACATVEQPRSGRLSQTTGPRLVHSEDASVGRVFVVDEDGLRYLRFDHPDGDDQSVVSLADPAAVPMDYVRLAAVGLAHIGQPRQVLMIGLGAGTFTSMLWRILPGLEIDAVEISPVVFRVARTYFGLPSDPRYRVHLMDGSHYVSGCGKRYELILLDAYTGEDIPAALAGTEFFAQVRSLLRPNGAALLNLALDADQEIEVLTAFRRAFAAVTCYRTAEGDNLIAVGAANDRAPKSAQVLARAGVLDRDLALPFSLQAEASRLVLCPVR